MKRAEEWAILEKPKLDLPRQPPSPPVLGYNVSANVSVFERVFKCEPPALASGLDASNFEQRRARG